MLCNEISHYAPDFADIENIEFTHDNYFSLSVYDFTILDPVKYHKSCRIEMKNLLSDTLRPLSDKEYYALAALLKQDIFHGNADIHDRPIDYDEAPSIYVCSTTIQKRKDDWQKRRNNINMFH